MRDAVRRIGILYPFINLDSVPCLCNAAVMMAECGYLVDIYTCLDPDCVPPAFDDGRISVLPSLVPGRNRRRLHRAISGIGWSLRFLARHRRVPYLCLIGVDPEGLAMACRYLARLAGVPLAYWSLELLLSHELETERDRRLKARERAVSRRAPFVIIQDDERAGLLARDNGISPGRFLCVPNAPLGPADGGRSSYLRERFGLPAETRIILHTGSLADWTGARDLMRSTRDWPDDWILVCHTRYQGRSLDQGYLKELRRLAAPGRVVFSTDPLPQKEYPALVRSADVGVAFYCVQPGMPSLQDNLRHVGLSSGKVAYYLQAGLPVLVNDIASLRRLVGTYGCGEAVDDPGRTAAAIGRILARYGEYSRNAVTCFERELDFAGRFRRVLAALDDLRRERP